MQIEVRSVSWSSKDGNEISHPQVLSNDLLLPRLKLTFHRENLVEYEETNKLPDYVGVELFKKKSTTEEIVLEVDAFIQGKITPLVNEDDNNSLFCADFKNLKFKKGFTSQNGSKFPFPVKQWFCLAFYVEWSDGTRAAVKTPDHSLHFFQIVNAKKWKSMNDTKTTRQYLNQEFL